MSGASPMYVAPTASGPVNVMSGATIEEARTDVLGKGSYYFDSGRMGLATGISSENDYFSFNLGLDGETHFFDKMTTLLAGGAASFDTIEPTDADRFVNRPEKEKKQSYSAFVGVAQVLGKATAAQTTLSYRNSQGYLSDPYKEVFVGSTGSLAPDSRPEIRHQLSWLTRLRRHFRSVNGTVHADYQFAIDSWEITAHTLELAWYQTVLDAVQVVPHARYYTQSQAEFYAPTFDGTNTDPFRSSDYRLSPYGAISVGVRAQVDFAGFWKTNWKGVFSYERYMSDAEYALGSVDTENPGLVDYNLFSVNLTGRF